eukprot:gene4925-biopygen7463
MLAECWEDGGKMVAKGFLGCSLQVPGGSRASSPPSAATDATGTTDSTAVAQRQEQQKLQPSLSDGRRARRSRGERRRGRCCSASTARSGVCIQQAGCVATAAGCVATAAGCVATAAGCVATAAGA